MILIRRLDTLNVFMDDYILSIDIVLVKSDQNWVYWLTRVLQRWFCIIKKENMFYPWKEFMFVLSKKKIRIKIRVTLVGLEIGNCLYFPHQSQPNTTFHTPIKESYFGPQGWLALHGWIGSCELWCEVFTIYATNIFLCWDCETDFLPLGFGDLNSPAAIYLLGG